MNKVNAVNYGGMLCHLSHPPLLESYGQLLPSKPPQPALQFCSSVPGTFTTSFGYGGVGRGWGGWGGGMGMGSSTTTSSTYTEGTLIIDGYGPDDKKMVWRGTGTVTVKSKPDKQAQQIDNILSKLGDKWDKILAGQGK